MTERWWEIEQVRKTIINDNDNNADRYNSEYTSSYSKLSISNVFNYLSTYDGFLILEITSVTGCCSAYDSIQIKDIMSSFLYFNYYKKVVLYSENEVIMLENYFKINELPALLFIYKRNIIGKILGIYRNCEEESIQFIKDKVKEIISPYVGFI